MDSDNDRNSVMIKDKCVMCLDHCARKEGVFLFCVMFR